MELKQAGKRVYIYGASTKGNVLLQTFGIGYDLVIAAAERNPNKYGCRTPGTGIPIVPEDVARKDAEYFFVLPWHFKKEFLEREAAFLEQGGRFIFPLPKLSII